jgi:fructose-bisphosphate aldolase class II
MTLLTTKEILTIADRERFAVGAFNVHNMEYTQGVIAAAELEQAPVILMIGEAMIPFAGLDMLGAICLQAAHSASVPVAIALDHGTKQENIDGCLRLGVSIMFDGSHHPFEENIRLTKAVVEQAHAAGQTVEGELGSIAGSEDGEAERMAMKTDPDLAAEFVARTGVDILAISIGNVHGLYKGEAKIDVDLLKIIRQRVDVPLVMHGGSDLPVEIAHAVVREGMSKFNIGTDIKYAFSQTLRTTLTNGPDLFQPPHVLAPARDAVCAVAREKIKMFNSNGKANLYMKNQS